MQDFIKYLNPVHKQIDAISDFSSINPTDPLQIEEYPHLQKTLSLIIEDVRKGIDQMSNLQEQIEHFIWLIDTETGDDKTDAISTYNKLLKEMENLIERINRSLDTLDNPYFGKVIFDRRADLNIPARELIVYIGKFAYFDKNDNTTLISDWRAPISNLYYNYEGPTEEAFFDSPVGKQTGDLKQKRQLSISTGRINQVYEVKTGNAAADEFLLSQLNKRLGKKLSEIVSTIQAQQNQIIRDDINQPILIQGVAGSGKTTIILHRLAYLFYTYKEEIRPERSLVIAPNKVFLDYVSDVLPSLGVSGINQDTYLFWARKILDFTNKHVMDYERSNAVMKFKGSYKLLLLLKRYLEDFEEELLENIPTSVGYDINQRFLEMKISHKDLSIKELLDLSTQAVFATRRFENPDILGNALGRADTEEKRIRQIKQYIENSLDPYKIYINFIRQLPKMDSHDIVDDPSILLNTVKESLDIFKKPPSLKGYSINDLAPLLEIQKYLYGTSTDQYDYIIVDEAQDLSPFQLISLSRYSKNNNITFAGDVAQAIMPPYHITDWADFIPYLSNELNTEISTHDLNRSYRSTHEIIEFANNIIKRSFPTSYKLPEAVLRHGSDVGLYKYDCDIFDKKYLKGSLLNLIKKEIKNETPTIAIITKNEKDADKLLEIIKLWNLDLPVFSYSEENFHTGIQILPVKYAKGLEFDTVIVFGVDGERYNEIDDSRLLYVAMTRALHQLNIFYSGDNRSPLLPDTIQ